jgi:hypothetical protein
MSSSFHAEVVAQMATMSGAAPGNDDYFFRNIHTSSGIGVGVVQPHPLSVLVPPTRAEIEAAIGLSRPDDSDSQKINALQSQVNMLLRLFLSRRSWSSSPRLRSGSASPQALSAHSRDVSPPACFVCPICKEHLTEKSFVKHIQKWPEHVEVRIRKGMCPGIRSDSHPFMSFVPAIAVEESFVSRLQRLVSHVVKMTHPGSYAAHSEAGTGLMFGCNVSFGVVNALKFQITISRSRLSLTVLMLSKPLTLCCRCSTPLSPRALSRPCCERFLLQDCALCMRSLGGIIGSCSIGGECACPLVLIPQLFRVTIDVVSLTAFRHLVLHNARARNSPPCCFGVLMQA